MTDIRAYPDLSGAAPKDCAWYAIDCDTYDPPDCDSTARHQMGQGATPEEAIADLRQIMLEIAEGELTDEEIEAIEARLVENDIEECLRRYDEERMEEAHFDFLLALHDAPDAEDPQEAEWHAQRAEGPHPGDTP